MPEKSELKPRKMMEIAIKAMRRSLKEEPVGRGSALQA